MVHFHNLFHIFIVIVFACVVCAHVHVHVCVCDHVCPVQSSGVPNLGWRRGEDQCRMQGVTWLIGVATCVLNSCLCQLL